VSPEALFAGRRPPMGMSHMNLPDLHSVYAVNTAIRRHLEEKRVDAAVLAASAQLADALGDVAVAELACGRVESAVEKLTSALELKPNSPAAFHNFVATLLSRTQLRGPALDLTSRIHSQQHPPVSVP
jgi:hypothetical protein